MSIIRHGNRLVMATVLSTCLAVPTWGQAPLKVGEHVAITIDSSAPSAFETASTPDGRVFELSHKGATYIALHFYAFDLEDEEMVIVSDPKGGQRYVLTGKGKMESGTFWAQHIKGDTVVIEYVSKEGEEGDGFVIDEYVAGNVNLGGSFIEAICGADDKRNAVCYQSSYPTEYDRGRAVARLLINGSSLCTGWLASANNHLITNEHCITTSSDAQNTDYEFMAEAPNCGDTNCQLCFPGTVISGATFIQDSPGLDYALVQITSGNPAATYGYLNIDNRTAVVGEEIYIPQYPGGRAKEFGIESSDGADAGGVCHVTTFSAPCSGSGYNDVGYQCDTEGGSSGSPVLARSSHKVIALHHCANCPNRGVPIDLICAEICSLLGPQCDTDPECDDGLWCNGSETCVGQQCQVGTDPCPGQSCDEATDQCVAPPSVVYEWTMDTDPGWTTQGLWAHGQPTGGGGQYGGPDPTSGATGNNVYGYNLNGDYENNLGETHLTSTVIDCTGLSSVSLKFQRWLGVEQPTYDHAYVRVSNNGSTWTTIWQNSAQVADSAWSLQEFDISAEADDQSTVYLRWTIGTTDSSWQFCGWNIDDVQILAYGGGGGCTVPADCDDGDACTTDTCDTGTGVCSNVAISCDDGNGCTDDSCDPGSGCVNTNNTAACDDGDACTTNDTCSGGACAGGAPPNCDDGNVCTDDSCDPGSGCVNANNTAACDDSDACTTGDACSGGACVGGAPPNCDDGNICTDDSCDPGSGCVNANNTAACDDGDACTTGDACSGGACVSGGPTNCDDGNVCTDDSCDPATGCVNTDNTAACDDGDACTAGDTCSGGFCVGGPPPSCDDGNMCTDDSCDPASGLCVNANNTAPCDDGDVCTSGDACSGGVCVGGAPATCDDGNVCTDDSCDPGSGCVNANNTAACDDGDACTTGDTCSVGACVGGAPPNCDDGNICTDDSCDPGSGCVSANNTASCDDGDACTTGDACSGGACVGGPPPNCDDGNVCTDDSCNPASGACEYVNNAAACDDGDACTTGDACSGGICTGGAPPNCDDGNVCTDDSCDPASGCVNTNNAAGCDDLLFCNGADTCSGGSCSAHAGDPCLAGETCNEATNTCDTGPPPGEGYILSKNADFSTDDRTFFRTETIYMKVWTDQVDFNDIKKKEWELRDTGGQRVKQQLTNHFDGTYTASFDLVDLPSNDTDWTWKGKVEDNGGTKYNPTDAITVLDAPACTIDPDCDDGDACTTDVCSGGSCSNTPVNCEDSDACTTDYCSGGVCFNDPISCDDGDACTTDTCDPGTGCSNTPINCDDGDPCTSDSCSGGICFNDPLPTCCGDTFCDPGEDSCNCPADCGAPPGSETNCTDGIDEDCDGNTDCADADCSGDPACSTPTGEGYILSKNPDFSTDDRTFNRSDTIYMKMWSDQVDFNDINRARWELKDPSKNKVREPLTNHFDGTYTAAYDLVNLPSNDTDWTWKGEVKDNAGNQFKPTDAITVLP